MCWNLVALSDDVGAVKHDFPRQKEDRQVGRAIHVFRRGFFPRLNEICYGFTGIIGSAKMPGECFPSSLLNPGAFTATAKSKTGGVKANCQFEIAS